MRLNDRFFETKLPHVLVTGGTGRVGTMVRNAWATNPPGFLPLYLGRHEPRDIRWPTDLAHGLPHADAVISMWGQTHGDAHKLQQNLTLAQTSRELAKVCGASRVFHISSSSVYGPGQNLSEDAPLRPVSDYGRYKVATEELIAGFDDPDIKHVVLRVANVVGADSLAPMFQTPRTVELDQFSDGSGPLRSYMGARDLARVLAGLMALPAEALPSVLNVATEIPLAMQDLITSAGCDFVWRPAPANAVKEVSLDTGRLHALLPDLKVETDTDKLVAYFTKLSRAA